MFSELRKKVPNLVHLGYTLVPLREYDATVALRRTLTRDGAVLNSRVYGEKARVDKYTRQGGLPFYPEGKEDLLI
jgi:hypothetical protein